MNLNWLNTDYILNSIYTFCFHAYIWCVKHMNYFNKPILIEPCTSEWISICSLIYIDYKYQLVNTDIIDLPKKIEEEYNSFYKSFYSNYIYSDNTNSEIFSVTKEYIFIAKQPDNTYICRVCFPGHIKQINSSFQNKKNKNNKPDETIEEDIDVFLYVEYMHPSKMNTPIILPFSSGLLQVYNELFTPTFVLRQLQTQTDYYFFDMDYELTFLDKDLNTFHLKSNQYIFLDSSFTYEIISR